MVAPYTLPLKTLAHKLATIFAPRWSEKPTTSSKLYLTSLTRSFSTSTLRMKQSTSSLLQLNTPLRRSWQSTGQTTPWPQLPVPFPATASRLTGPKTTLILPALCPMSPTAARLLFSLTIKTLRISNWTTRRGGSALLLCPTLRHRARSSRAFPLCLAIYSRNSGNPCYATWGTRGFSICHSKLVRRRGAQLQAHDSHCPNRRHSYSRQRSILAQVVQGKYQGPSFPMVYKVSGKKLF